MRLEGTVALVTGGTRRVGRAIVLELTRGGCDVAVHCRTPRTEADELVDLVRSMGRRAVVTVGELAEPSHWPRIVKSAVEQLGRLDVLINNASAFRTEGPDTLEAFDVAVWESMLRVNLLAPVGLCHCAKEYLQAHGGGAIVNLCDIWIDRPSPEHLSYCASKAALAAATKALARAFAPTVRVNAVSPGIAVFPNDYPPETRQRLVSRVPLNREGTPEEVAGLVRFLVEQGDYITGQVISIDGGRSLA